MKKRRPDIASQCFPVKRDRLVQIGEILATMRSCCGQSGFASSMSDPFKKFASHRELLSSQGYDAPLHPLLPSGKSTALTMFVGSGPGKFEPKPSETATEPDSWTYNRLVQMEYSLGGAIGWQLASSMAEAYRSLNLFLPPEIAKLFPKFMMGPKRDSLKTDTAIRKAQQFFPAWHTNAVKCHAGPTYTTPDTQKAMEHCVNCYLKEEIRIIQPPYIFTLGKKAIPALEQVTGLSGTNLGDVRDVILPDGSRARWFAWWHNPRFNAHKNEFIKRLTGIFEANVPKTS